VGSAEKPQVLGNNRVYERQKETQSFPPFCERPSCLPPSSLLFVCAHASRHINQNCVIEPWTDEDRWKKSHNNMLADLPVYNASSEDQLINTETSGPKDISLPCQKRMNRNAGINR
jgi:hypothetical protein